MAKKPAARKKAAKPVRKKPKKAAAKKPPRKAPSKKSPRKAPQAPAAAPVYEREKPISLGRPKVTGEELLFMLFHGDYEARQIFEFLRVQTVKELEQHNPKEIFKRLTQPVANAVDRIRRGLAEKNRCLAGDEDYLLTFKAEQAGK
jgi:hypothetical protein